MNDEKTWLIVVERYEKRRTASQEQVSGLRRRYEATKKQLEENETYKKLCTLEKKLKNYAQSIFTLTEYIETKTRESDFNSLKVCRVLSSSELSTN